VTPGEAAQDRAVPVAARAVAALTLVALLAGPAAGDPQADGTTVAGSPPASVSQHDATARAPAVSTLAIPIGGVSRTATVVLPDSVARPAGHRPPLLVVLHGVGGSGAELRGLGFEELALARGVAVAYPDGWRASWNDGRPGIEHESPTEVRDDVAFLQALIAELGTQAGIDAGRVAVAGFSNGALMTGRLACEAAGALVAVALVAGTVGEGLLGTCRPTHPVPVVLVASDGDGIVPYGGGRIADFDGRRRGRVTSAAEFLAFWAAASGCGPTVATAVAGAAVPVTRLEAQECRPGSAVVHYRVSGGGHEWYRVAGFDTTTAVWDAVAPALGVA
jgi:polyhydroxybutyrate depolymerase